MPDQKRRISAKAVLADIHSGMTVRELAHKHRLSREGLVHLLKKLKKAGLIDWKDLERMGVRRRNASDSGLYLSGSTSAPGWQATSETPPPKASTHFVAKAVAGLKGEWRVSLWPGRLTLEALDGSDAMEFSRQELGTKIELRKSLILPNMLILHLKKRAAFQLDGNQSRILSEWAGRPTHREMQAVLRRSFGFGLAIGIVYLVLSLPMPADPESPFAPVLFDPVAAFLGLSLIGLALASRFWPRPIIFLLDGVWFLLLAADVAYSVHQGQSPWWLIGALLLVYFAINRLLEFRRFRGVGS
jgi:hypothetical protein